MAKQMEPSAKRPRISIDVPPELRCRLRLAVEKHDRTVQQYVLEAIEERLQEDLGDESEGMLAVSAKTDPVLAELWDNKKDAEYDRL
jgi:predicted DNA-binding protein